MPRALLSLLMLAALGSTARAAEDCPAITRSEGPPVYVLLYGYAHGAPDGTPLASEPLPELAMVDDDLAHMNRFFEALGPAQMHLHGEPGPTILRRISAFRLRPPTWRSLRQSVAEIAADIDHHPSKAKPRIYLYLAGHGVRLPSEAGARLALFGRADGAGSGYDGVIDSALFARYVLTPLARRGDVHLIADTCFSYTLLQMRAMKRTARIEQPPPLETYDAAFGEAFPGVGAHLAGRRVTFEGAERGGHFSHALRAAASGVADEDGDGVVTYAEMSRALHDTAADDPTLRPAEVIPPADDAHAPFIRWDQSPAVRHCAPPGDAAALDDGGDRFTTLPARVKPVTLWLSPFGRFALRDDEPRRRDDP